VLSGLAAAARTDPHRYAALLAVVKKDRQELRERNEFYAHKAALRHRGVEALPLSLTEITGGIRRDPLREVRRAPRVPGAAVNRSGAPQG
jgi:hypothetical protein